MCVDEVRSHKVVAISVRQRLHTSVIVFQVGARDLVHWFMFTLKRCNGLVEQEHDLPLPAS